MTPVTFDPHAILRAIMLRGDIHLDTFQLPRLFAKVDTDKRSHFLVALIIVLGGFLRFYHLNSYSLWSDEFVTLMIVSKSSYLDLIKTCFEVPQPMPPFYFLINKVVFDFFVPGEIALRLFSCTSSVLLVYFVFALGKALFSSEVGLYAALLCAINSTQIVYAQNARPYAFCLLLSSISMLYFLKWLQQENSWPLRLGYLLSTVLLFYSHYIFFTLLLVQNVHSLLLWLTGRVLYSPGDSVLVGDREGDVSKLRTEGQLPEGSAFLPHLLRGISRGVRLRSWLLLQLLIGLMLFPLWPQLWKTIHSRYSLNWENKVPGFGDFLIFMNPRILFWSLTISLLIIGLRVIFRRQAQKSRVLKPAGIEKNFPVQSFLLLMLWYMIPVSFFFFLAEAYGLNLFVERYLVLVSLPVFILLPSLALVFRRRAAGRIFVWVYLLFYAIGEPGAIFKQKGEFSQGVPGGNEWRETLLQLGNAAFQAPLLLFQSPFIESNQLQYGNNTKLFDYLCTPLRSFYMKEQHRSFVLLPVHWWINNPLHVGFKAGIKSQIMSQDKFVLLSTQEFWDNFEPWLDQELSGGYEVKVLESFESSGALRLKKVLLIPKLENSSSSYRVGLKEFGVSLILAPGV